jgi:hypothetical protein
MATRDSFERKTVHLVCRRYFHFQPYFQPPHKIQPFSPGCTSFSGSSSYLANRGLTVRESRKLKSLAFVPEESLGNRTAPLQAYAAQPRASLLSNNDQGAGRLHLLHHFLKLALFGVRLLDRSLTVPGPKWPLLVCKPAWNLGRVQRMLKNVVPGIGHFFLAISFIES